MSNPEPSLGSWPSAYPGAGAAARAGEARRGCARRRARGGLAGPPEPGPHPARTRTPPPHHPTRTPAPARTLPSEAAAAAPAAAPASQEARTFDSTAFLAGVATAVVVYWGASRHLAPRHAGLLLRTAFRCGIWMPGAATAAWWVMRRMTRQ